MGLFTVCLPRAKSAEKTNNSYQTSLSGQSFQVTHEILIPAQRTFCTEQSIPPYTFQIRRDPVSALLRSLNEFSVSDNSLPGSASQSALQSFAAFRLNLCHKSSEFRINHPNLRQYCTTSCIQTTIINQNNRLNKKHTHFLNYSRHKNQKNLSWRTLLIFGTTSLPFSRSPFFGFHHPMVSC